jgi:hypothetical protein
MGIIQSRDSNPGPPKYKIKVINNFCTQSQSTDDSEGNTIWWEKTKSGG